MPRASSRRALATFEDLVRVREEVGVVDDRVVRHVPIAEIQSSPRNPRQKLTAVDELAASLQSYGLMQPIVVRRLADGYQLIAGHRRLEAARSLDWTDIAAVIRDEGENDAYILTLVENLQREDLTAHEEAEALGLLIRERKWSVRKVAQAIKRDPLYVSRRLRVFEDPILRRPVLDQRLPVSTAEVLLRVEPEQRANLVKEAISNGWGQMEARRVLRDRRPAPSEQAKCGVTPHQRSEALVKLLGEASALLDAGPIADLDTNAQAELHTFHQRLSQISPT